MSSVFYVDGEFLERDDAKIPVTDLGVLRGYGIFDFMRTYNGAPFHLDRHVARLFRSADVLGMTMPWTQQEVIDIVMQTVARNDLPECNVRIVVTGGESDDFITPLEKPRLVVLVTPSKRPAEHYYTDGAKVITVNEARYLPGAKSLNYIPAIRALKAAYAQDAVEAIYLSEADHALEGTTTNLFAFFGDTLVTPEAGILPGITRGVVLGLAQAHYTIDERPLHLEALYDADEVFITASNKQVMPIVQVNDKHIAGGKPGPRTRHIMQLFGDYVGVPLPLPASAQTSGD